MNARLHKAVIAAAVVAMLAQGTVSAELNSRGFTWGASMDEVLAGETATLLVKASSTLLYSDTLLGMEGYPYCLFLDTAGLTGIGYLS